MSASNGDAASVSLAPTLDGHDPPLDGYETAPSGASRIWFGG